MTMMVLIGAVFGLGVYLLVRALLPSAAGPWQQWPESTHFAPVAQFTRRSVRPLR